MKKVIYLVVVFSLISTLAFAGKAINMSELPKAAQDCINTLFKGVQTTYVEKDFDGYEVRLSNGAKVDFYNNGDWEEISNYAGLPDTLLPAAALKTVKQNHPQAMVIKIEKEWGGFDIKLNNNMEMKIDKDGKLLSQKMDD